ncbi:undecaprenyl-diphosphatase [Geothermobacter ehrlichii]|uniref:Undecaprenyl-diphosphatase n=1 Tax=Geothermobacter ehrlichii TaxID=213224 RepID=A0A5D3WK57_9BACT|nr:undecaprenyl-diphosphate phosphatase [Geothermobacter ehrlichii]TYO97508.1 undecaprenyl-diphosphatase [Geothermobacter ehrlichii]
MSIGQAVFLGLLQGLTEFLPVSSSGHLVIAQHFLTGFRQPGVLFDVMLHVGTMLAVCLYFRHDLAALLSAPLRRNEEDRRQLRLLGLLALASVPTAIIGLSLEDFFSRLFHSLPTVAAMLLVTGSLLFVAERLRRGERGIDRLGAFDALLVGTVQGLAIIPGISRSGSTIAVLLLRGVDGEAAARFSFLLALPAVGGAALLSLRDLRAVQAAEIPAYLAGTLAAFLIGLASIHLLMGVIRKRRLLVFAVYCWLVGLLFLLVPF